MLTDFHFFSTRRLRDKFATNSHLHIAPHLRYVATLPTGVDKGGQGAQAPQWPGKKERKGVFLSDVQPVYLYSLFN